MLYQVSILIAILCLNNGSLYVYIHIFIISIGIYPHIYTYVHYMDIAYLFIISSGDGCLGCFYFWAIKNGFARNIYVQFLYECISSFLSGLFLGVELLSHMLTLYFTLCGTAKLFSKAVIPF